MVDTGVFCTGTGEITVNALVRTSIQRVRFIVVPEMTSFNYEFELYCVADHPFF